MEVNLVDNNFVGRDLQVNPRYFKWITGNKKVSDHIFFTDNMLDKVDKLKTDQKRVAWLLEPKAISPHIYTYVENNHQKFYKVLTFDRDLIDKIPNGLFCPYGTFWVTDREKYDKQNLVSIILSFKNFTEGQNLRHLILNSKFNNLDYYGRFDSNKQIDSKNEALDNYYFSIAVENSIQNSYWTEKLLDCFITKTIPVYYGTKDVETFFNKKGIIFFNGLEHLSQILPKLTPDIYKERQEYIEENYNLAKKYKDPEDYIFFNYPELLT
jgi:hypothetical protein